MEVFSAILVTVLLAACPASARVDVDPLSVLYLPHDYTPEPQYSMFGASVEQVAYDPENFVVYTIGGAGYLHAIDISDPNNAKVVDSDYVPGEPNDLDVCGRYVALSVRDEYGPLPGTAVIYEVYNRISGHMQKVNEIEIGASPASAIVFTKDCQTLLVANEGEAGRDADGQFLDPEGSVSVIKFQSSDLSGPYVVRTADFRKFDER